MKDKAMKTNILVQYRGGGYGGCIWEWNFFYIDEFGVFNDIYSSGCSGIDNLPDAEQLIINNKNGTYIYDMSKEKDIKTFREENHAWNVQAVCRWFEDYNSSCVEFFAVCFVCENEIYADDIVIEGQEIMCHECYFCGQCPCCECYVCEENIIGPVNQDEHYGFDYLCFDCKENHDEEREAINLEDIRWQAFCTGIPDIFSDELRAIWT